MKPENKSKDVLKAIKANAKMYEYGIPLEAQNVEYSASPASLFPLTIGLLGDLCQKINNEQDVGDEFDSYFSPQFFDSFINAKLNNEENEYLYLIGSSAFFLANMPGSASVLINKVPDDINVGADGFEFLLRWLLLGKLEKTDVVDYPCGKYVQVFQRMIISFFNTGVPPVEFITDKLNRLRQYAYQNPNPRVLLLVDIISAVIRKKIANSSWKLLPEYSELSVDVWRDSLSSKNFIKELWPAQRLIGEYGCYKGVSAVIQMPTSAGKTKSTEIIIRSAFLSGRNVKLAVIVAPFKALCHEIKTSMANAFNDGMANVRELTDVLQMDIDDLMEKLDENYTKKRNILVLTPEKLLYVLRHNPRLANKIGLIIFDEAHQFDSGERGITYELLLTSLKLLLPEQTQKILISAVISNAQSIAEWFNGSNIVVQGDKLSATPKSFGFVNWEAETGQINYMNNENIEVEDFFVPNVIKQTSLEKKNKREKQRYFPEKSDVSSIALNLGLKLVGNGGVAIFCGQKSTANKISNALIDALDRNLEITLPKEYSEQREIVALTMLQSANFGENSSIAKSSSVGVFQHHANIPHGIRIAIEYAMRENLVKFVICTSTLAQGVNLPIRYLIITSNWQATNRIKTRDFHNLIGRTGRAGLYTEGSILFADSETYGLRNSSNFKERKKWNETKHLIDISNSEECTSSLLDLFTVKNDYGEKTKRFRDISSFVTSVLDGRIDEWEQNIREKFKSEKIDVSIVSQLNDKKRLIGAIESFLLSDRAGMHGIEPTSPEILAKSTLAYALADNETKIDICAVFKTISDYIDNVELPELKQNTYGKTLLNLSDLQQIEKWANENIEAINSVDNSNDMLTTLWPLISLYLNERIKDKLYIAKEWINGCTFYCIAASLETRDASNVVDLLESKLAFESSLVFGALIDLVENIPEIDESKKELIKLLQKQIKYGLPSITEIMIYEMGFVDRVIATDLKKSLNIDSADKKDVRVILKTPEAREFVKKYPAYFRKLQNSL